MDVCHHSWTPELASVTDKSEEALKQLEDQPRDISMDDSIRYVIRGPYENVWHSPERVRRPF